MINISEILGREKGYYTEQGEKDFFQVYKILSNFSKNLTQEEKELLLDIANSNYRELTFLLIDVLEKK